MNLLTPCMNYTSIFKNSHKAYAKLIKLKLAQWIWEKIVLLYIWEKKNFNPMLCAMFGETKMHGLW